MITLKQLKKAIESSKSKREAAKKLGITHTGVDWLLKKYHKKVTYKMELIDDTED